MSKIAECCANCKYWDVYEKTFEKYHDLSQGNCHRYPPTMPVFDGCHDQEIPVPQLVLMLHRGVALSEHPFTFGEDWCGEFKCMEEPRWIDE